MFGRSGELNLLPRTVLYKAIANRIYPAIPFRNVQTFENPSRVGSLRNRSFVQAFLVVCGCLFPVLNPVDFVHRASRSYYL